MHFGPRVIGESAADPVRFPFYVGVGYRTFAIAPVRLTRENVGRSPVVPQCMHGETIEPSVSVPMAKPTRPAAVAAAARFEYAETIRGYAAGLHAIAGEPMP